MRRPLSIPHVIPWRPYLAAPQKPQNSNVLISKVEAPAGELRATFKRNAASRNASHLLLGCCATPPQALHPLRDATPDQNGCIAYGSGALPTSTSLTAVQTTTHANFNTTTADPTQRNDRSTSTRGRQYPTPSHISELPDRGLNSFRI